jgi:hypothetical protein
MDPLTLGRKIADAANQAVRPLLKAAERAAVQLTLVLLSLLVPGGGVADQHHAGSAHELAAQPREVLRDPKLASPPSQSHCHAAALLRPDAALHNHAQPSGPRRQHTALVAERCGFREPRLLPRSAQRWPRRSAL